MTDPTSAASSPSLPPAPASPDGTPTPWDALLLQVRELQAEAKALEHANKLLRQQLETVIEHRQKSHSELVILLTNLVSKLPLNDVGVIISKLVEHNASVSQFLSRLARGSIEGTIAQPALLKTLDQTERDLLAAIPPLVEELLRREAPFEPEMLRALEQDPERFFTPGMVRATRCFVKGQVPRERVLRCFGEQAMVFFNDLTTDPKLNPRPKPDEIVLAFRPDTEEVFQKYPDFLPDKRADLMQLFQRVQAAKGSGADARAQRNAFAKLSFVIELLHYYRNQNTEAPETAFAHRLPALLEQLVLTGDTYHLEEDSVKEAEALLAHIVVPDYRQSVINNLGKSNDAGKTLRFVLKLRGEKVPDQDHVISEFIKHLIPAPPEQPPSTATLSGILRLLPADVQRLVIRALMHSDRLRKDQANSLARALARELGIDMEKVKPADNVSPEVDRQIAWNRIKDMISRRADPKDIAAAIRDRLHARYDTDEIRQSWITLTEADPMSLIRIFCHLPFLPTGKTDAIARPVMETYVSRLTHEKYAPTYNKIVTSLRNMHRMKPDSPTLVNFTALVRWASAEAADKLCADIGMAAPAASQG
jgi:hypothetical protein